MLILPKITNIYITLHHPFLSTSLSFMNCFIKFYFLLHYPFLPTSLSISLFSF